MTALEDIAAERKRQIEIEGWTSEHDDTHDHRDFCDAAAAYFRADPSIWPWDKRSWKPKDRRRDLIRAGALLLAYDDAARRRIAEIADSALSSDDAVKVMQAPLEAAFSDRMRCATMVLMDEIVAEIEHLDRTAMQ